MRYACVNGGVSESALGIGRHGVKQREENHVRPLVSLGSSHHVKGLGRRERKDASSPLIYDQTWIELLLNATTIRRQARPYHHVVLNFSAWDGKRHHDGQKIFTVRSAKKSEGFSC